MATPSILYPLAEVLKQLSITLSSQQSGTFLIATEHNTSCRFAIEQGQITHCTHSRAKGAAAVLSLLEVQQASCAFSEHLKLPFRAEAAVTHEFCVHILDLQPIPIDDQPITTKKPLERKYELAIEPTNNRQKRFYRGGYALGENDAAM